MNQPLLKTFTLFGLMCLAGCAYKVDKLTPASPLTDTKVKAQLTFSLIETNILQAKCIQCHSNTTKNSGKTNLETYASVKAALPQIKDDINEGVMPKSPGTSLTSEEKFLLLEWIQMGAPETAPVVGGGDTPVPSPTPAPVVIPDPPTPDLQPTFASINTLIFKAKCLDCHNSSGDASDVPFEQYSDIVTGDIVVPGNATKSSLIKHIILGAKKLMPPVKSKYKAIAPEDVAIITQWITAGALNN